MDFFDRESRAHRQTALLLWLFAVAVLCVVVLSDLILASLIWVLQHPVLPRTRWNPIMFLLTIVFNYSAAVVHPLVFLRNIWSLPLYSWLTGGTLLLIAGGCLYKRWLLSGGGPAVAQLLGGRRVESTASDPAEKRLYNVVEEMAIASGLSVPDVYVLDHETGLNSFAAGHTREDVAIAVTYNCLVLLTRAELQGMIAHEFSHVLNGDTRLNMRLMSLAHGLSWPTIFGRVLLYGSARPQEPGESLYDQDTPFVQVRPLLFPLAFIFLTMGLVSTPFVRFIKSRICCEREWLADASAVQFTRNPLGIEGALMKIGGLLKQGRLDSPYAETASHLYFASSNFDPWSKFLSTHPPLAARISAIDPAFNGQFPHVLTPPSREAEFDRRYEENVRRMRAESSASETQE